MGLGILCKVSHVLMKTFNPCMVFAQGVVIYFKLFNFSISPPSSLAPSIIIVALIISSGPDTPTCYRYMLIHVQ